MILRKQSKEIKNKGQEQKMLTHSLPVGGGFTILQMQSNFSHSIIFPQMK